MGYDHEKGRPGRVAEPAQVYLDPDDQDRLARLTTRLHTTKSDVLRRGLEALERELTDPDSHPALRLIGIGRSGAGDEVGPTTEAGSRVADAARDHDEVLVASEEASWGEGSGEDDAG